MGQVYKVGTRTSPLALAQVDEIRPYFKKARPDLAIEVVGFETYGDRDKNTPISEMEGSDFFTREIDNALLNKKIDFAVHSAKDLPDKLRTGLKIAVMTPSRDPYDVLVSRTGLTLDALPAGSRIGTSSIRRKNSIRAFRPDLEIVDIRGNIEERLVLLDSEDLGAIVIAAAGLIRLGLEYRITQKIPFEILEPHPLQGKLAIVAREEDEDIIRLCRKCLRELER